MSIEVTPLMNDLAHSENNTAIWTTGPEEPYGKNSLAASALTAIKGSFLMESEGGPKIIRVGTWSQGSSKKTFLAIELERKFPGKNVMNIKDIGEEKTSFPLSTDSQTIQPLAQKMASMFVHALNRDIIPIDPQFLITSEGEVSWVDGDRWAQVKGWDYFSSFVMMDFVARFEKSPSLGKSVFNSLIDSIRRLPDEKQTTILKGLSLNLDHKVWVNEPGQDSKPIQKSFRQILQNIGVSPDSSF